MQISIVQVTVVIIIVFLSSCQQDHEREPISFPVPGVDTTFSIPQHFTSKNVRYFFFDLNGDSWQDVLLVASMPRSVENSASSDSLIVYLFDTTTGSHRRVAGYADFGIVEAHAMHIDLLSSPLIIADLNGGGNDLVTFGKVIFTFRNDTLEKLAEAPWGNPHLIVVDSTLVLEIHQSFSGTLPHAAAIEYADSLVAVVTRSTLHAHCQHVQGRIVQLSSELDSLRQHARHLSGEEYATVASRILSIANLMTKCSTTAQAQAFLAREQQRWKHTMPKQYYQLLQDFAEQFTAPFPFIR